MADDGWIGNAFLPERADAFLPYLAEGAAKAGRRIDDLDLLIPVAVEFTDDVAAVAELWRAGRRAEAAERVPRDIGFKTNLLGPPAVVKDRLRLYRQAGITTLLAKLDGDLQPKLDTLAQLIDLVAEVNAEER